MFIDSADVHQSQVIGQGIEEGYCALCRMPIDAPIDTLICAHWFLSPGPRGLQVVKLATVFQCFDLCSVVSYLRIASRWDKRPHRRTFAHVRDCVDSEHMIAISWRDRGWIFDCTGELVNVDAFTLSSIHRQTILESAWIELPKPGREVAITLIRQRKLP